MSTLQTLNNSETGLIVRGKINDNFTALNTDKMEKSGGTFTSDISVPDEAYGVGWNGSTEVPTKNAIYDKIETLGGGYTDEHAQDAIGTILTDTATINLTYDDATPSITASIVAGSVDETKLDVSVNASLGLADSAVQPAGLTNYFLKTVDDTDDVTEGAIKKFATSAEKTKLGFISVTQSVDLDTIESDTAINNAKVSNATHTGDVTGSTALTLASVNSNVGSFGLASSVAQFVVNAKGLITSAVNVAISIASTAITDFASASRAQTEAELVAGTNVTITPSGTGATRQLTISSAGGGGGGGSGDVVGPASSTDNAIARFDSTTGKLIQDSAVTIADTTGDITGGKYNTVAISGSATPTLAVTGTTAVSGTNTGDNATNTTYTTLATTLSTANTWSAVQTFLAGMFGLRNVANTFTSFFTNTNTASRTYTLKDADGTLAFTTDITGTNSGTNTGDQTSIVGITGTMAQFDTAVTNGNIVYQSQALGTPASGVLTNATGYQDIKLARIYPSTATDGATVTFDLSVNNKHQVTIAGNRTLALSNNTNIPVFSLNIKQDATGSRTVTWFSGITWAGGTAPTLTTTANKTDSFGFQQISAGVYLGFVIAQNI